MKTEARIDRLKVSAYTVPTDFPESDGTYAWDKTTLVLVEAGAGGHTGLGYTYSLTAAAHLVESKLGHVVNGGDAFNVQSAWAAMVYEVRNIGRPGIASSAIAAVDIALWDLKARLLGVPLLSLFGAAHESVLAYGSGGFTSYSIEQLQRQLGGWAEQGFLSVKMKVGTHPEQDVARARAVRAAIGDKVNLFVDGNGAYSRKQALEKAAAFAGLNITWFEEPVSSDDLAGLRLIRDRAPAGMDIAAGEYGWDLPYFRHMVETGAVDVLQADCTRCAGFTEWLRAGAVAAAHSVRYSAHTAPSLHAHVSCAVLPMYNIEYFHDHVRIEHMLFDGALTAAGGVLRPDLSRPGMGLELKRQDAEKYKVYESS
jgi:L-alanine-DL-glutamate epimerase-like enolase superfamily enzyme